MVLEEYSSEQTLLAYNALGRGTHLDLISDGYMIGIEKYRREDIGAPEQGDPKRFTELPNPNDDDQISKRNRRFIEITDDPKSMLVTHIASYFPKRGYVYNAYADRPKGKLGRDRQDYEKGYTALERLQEDLQDRILHADKDRVPYSHILIMGMGWNNDQHESIYRYNRIIPKSCKRSAYTLLIPIFRFFIQPMSSKLFVSKERNSR